MVILAWTRYATANLNVSQKESKPYPTWRSPSTTSTAHSSWKERGRTHTEIARKARSRPCSAIRRFPMPVCQVFDASRFIGRGGSGTPGRLWYRYATEIGTHGEPPVGSFTKWSRDRDGQDVALFRFSCYSWD